MICLNVSNQFKAFVSWLQLWSCVTSMHALFAVSWFNCCWTSSYPNFSWQDSGKQAKNKPKNYFVWSHHWLWFIWVCSLTNYGLIIWVKIAAEGKWSSRPCCAFWHLPKWQLGRRSKKQNKKQVLNMGRWASRILSCLGVRKHPYRQMNEPEWVSSTEYRIDQDFTTFSHPQLTTSHS